MSSQLLDENRSQTGGPPRVTVESQGLGCYRSHCTAFSYVKAIPSEASEEAEILLEKRAR
jgi:hypothetical protein